MTARQVQLYLLALGYSPGDADGIAGRQTQAAVRAFQEDYTATTKEKLAIDGAAGVATQKAIRQAVYDGWEKPADSANAIVEKTGTWWDDIKYFTRNDPYISCSCGKCGGFPAEPSEKLMRLADAVRTDIEKPMIPTSTVRCKEHNAAVNGVWNSRHLLGHAMDFWVPGMTADELLVIVKRRKEVVYAYKVDERVVHMDIGA